MFPCLKPKSIIFSLFITIIQISSILSNEEKCYSIKNCIKCPLLDFCEQCEPGFKMNQPKTKCNGKKLEIKQKEEEKPVEKSPKPSPSPSPQPSPSPSKKENNPFLNKAEISVNKAPNNPFQNVPVSSLQRFKDKEANNEIINKILVVILIILVISIIASFIYNFIKKRMNNGYTSDDGQEESAKVVYIR